MTSEPIRVFVGSDRSQALAVRVLEHSIRRHTLSAVDLHPMIELPVREPKDPRQGQRTGFSFSRFCIPKLCDYKGKAIYLDADMLVFADIGELWQLPFDEAKVLVQKDVGPTADPNGKPGAPNTRIKQCSVMVLDCARLDWDIGSIVDGLDRGAYTYEDLMYHLCILDESDVNYAVPFEWNSLEYFDSDTRLIHYTDMLTQPWVSAWNPRDHLWFNEVRLMLHDGSLTWKDVEREIRLGYFRPSLHTDLRLPQLPRPIRYLIRVADQQLDRRKGFVMHREVYEAKRRREELIRKYEEGRHKAGHNTHRKLGI